METYLSKGINQPENESGLLCAKAVRKFMIAQLQFSGDAASAVQFARCHRINENNRSSQGKPIICSIVSKISMKGNIGNFTII